MAKLSYEQHKQLLDIICDEVNVKNIGCGLKVKETGENIVYNRKLRKHVIESLH